jgi:hypothetical protein
MFLEKADISQTGCQASISRGKNVVDTICLFLVRTAGRRQSGKLFSRLPTVGGRAENYFPVSPKFAAGQKIIFRSPRSSRQGRKLFSSLPEVRGRAENYFPVSRRSAAGQKIIFQTPDGRRIPYCIYFGRRGGRTLSLRCWLYQVCRKTTQTWFKILLGVSLCRCGDAVCHVSAMSRQRIETVNFSQY